MDEKPKVRLTIDVEPEYAARLDNYWHDIRARNRTLGIRSLLDKGFEAVATEASRAARKSAA